MRNLMSFLVMLSIGSDPVSFNDLASALKKDKRWIVLSILLLIFFTVVGCAIVGTFRQGTSFNVSVVTEELRVETQDTPMSKWPVNNVTMSRTCPDDPDDVKTENFSGTVAVVPDTEIIFTRITQGDLVVKMKNSNRKKTALLTDEEEEPAGTLSDCSYFSIKGTTDRVTKGETIVLPVTGKIHVGNEIRFLSHHITPVLYNGNISIIDKTFILNENYSVGPFELEMGDSFIVKNQKVPSQGFISVNQDSAINLVFRAQGSHGLIKRYQSEAYELRNSIWSKLYQDEALSGIWMVVLLFLGIIRTYLKITVEDYKNEKICS